MGLNAGLTGYGVYDSISNGHYAQAGFRLGIGAYFGMRQFGYKFDFSMPQPNGSIALNMRLLPFSIRIIQDPALAGAMRSRTYSIATEIEIPRPANPTGRPGEHFKVANRGMFEIMDNPDNASYAKAMRDLIPNIDSVRGTAKAPDGWVWNHLVSRPGVMQLVPQSQHWAPNPLWSIFHPPIDGKNIGGFKLWGHLY